MKKLISLLLSVLMVLTVIPALASNADGENRANVTWSAGTTVTGALSNLSDGSASTRVDFENWSTASGKSAAVYWKLEDGVLTVVGSGDLTSDSSTAYAGFPWYTRGAEIETIVLIGFTTIGTGAFYSPQNSTSYRSVRKFIVGEGTTTLNDSAFGIYSGSMNGQVDIYLPSTLTAINNRAFRSINNYVGTVYVSPALDQSALTVGTNNPNKIMNKQFTVASYTHLYSTAYEWENNSGVTELKVGLKDASNSVPVSAADLDNYTWKVSIAASHDFGKTIECTPASVDENGVYRFRTCLEDGENQFIPRYHIISKAKTATDYSVQIDICDKVTGEVLYRSEYKNGFVCPTTLEAIYPEDHSGLYYLNGLMYLEGDLGDEYALDSVEVYCYRNASRYYKFAVVASNDNTLPASAWTWIGTQADDLASTNNGYIIHTQDPGKYRYVRIYIIGQYGANGNSGYHFTDVFVNISPEEVFVDPYERFGGTNLRNTGAYLHSVGFEVWPYADNGTYTNRAFFQAVLYMPGANFSSNVGTDDYEYTWNVYYKDQADENADWSDAYIAPVETVSTQGAYRIQVSECAGGADLCAGFTVGHTYDLVFDVMKNGEHQGFALVSATWTQKHQNSHDVYVDFWNSHDRSDGYETGDTVVTDRDAAVAAVLGFSESGAYSAPAAHTHAFEQTTVPATCVTTEKLANVCAVCGMIGEVLSENPDAAPIHKPVSGTLAVHPTFTAEGSMDCTCAYCGAGCQTPVPAATLGIYDEVIPGENGGQNCVSVVGTISDRSIDVASADKLQITVSFNGKTVTKTVRSVYTTVTGVAATSADTAAGSDLVYIDAGYIFALRLNGVPAGTHQISVTVSAILDGDTVASAAKDFTFTVAG